jgi:F0F1-type ATP synthase assembly protein I
MTFGYLSALMVGLFVGVIIGQMVDVSPRRKK